MPLPMPLRLAVLALLLAPPEAVAQEIPLKFRGTYAAADAPEACTVPDSDGRIAVDATSIQFFASACTIRQPRAGGDGRLTGRAFCSDEGEEGGDQLRGRIVLTLRGERLGVSIDGDPVRFYRRCARDLPVR